MEILLFVIVLLVLLILMKNTKKQKTYIKEPMPLRYAYPYLKRRYDYPHGQWRVGTGPLAMSLYDGN